MAPAASDEEAPREPLLTSEADDGDGDDGADEGAEPPDDAQPQRNGSRRQEPRRLLHLALQQRRWLAAGCVSLLVLTTAIPTRSICNSRTTSVITVLLLFWFLFYFFLLTLLGRSLPPSPSSAIPQSLAPPQGPAALLHRAATPREHHRGRAALS